MRTSINRRQSTIGLVGKVKIILPKRYLAKMVLEEDCFNFVAEPKCCLPRKELRGFSVSRRRHLKRSWRFFKGGWSVLLSDSFPGRRRLKKLQQQQQ